ncbi:MarR family transcriptional regulator [Bacillus swezeyi]|uniref:MarR family transcriptional regulator n=1 Tax=Bacillus swezeyi TaxID=1925020 RepID=A0A1R1QCB0_9BACI|nr:MarR family transcriptional regulator [Bacillus swezeyi]MEC1262781.1 MarR family transcriptional regulator [Bacillus swezeyi]MED1741551.1 MarR family transcriptional regulator [Bacillus swezeyi]MED2928360.1 MarR family transcriptional regulator [Bacillus swezeyi]MED2944640.1 MarR family transcriptional regulator [Bacillus swezeyi]MED2966475.1 MarR family transcriptional regulator [Bacillus swezeyi]
MAHDSLRKIEKEIALLVRLTTAYSPRFGNLDRSEYLLLSELDKQSPLAINTLAEKLMLNLSTASRQVSALERKNFIRRFPDPQNGRISLVEMTSEGIDILYKVQKARYDVYTEILQDWPNEELNILETHLTRLNRDFKKWSK